MSENVNSFFKELTMQQYMLSGELKPNKKKMRWQILENIAEEVIWPQLMLHLDSQEMSYQC